MQPASSHATFDSLTYTRQPLGRRLANPGYEGSFRSVPSSVALSAGSYQGSSGLPASPVFQTVNRTPNPLDHVDLLKDHWQGRLQALKTQLPQYRQQVGTAIQDRWQPLEQRMRAVFPGNLPDSLQQALSGQSPLPVPAVVSQTTERVQKQYDYSASHLQKTLTQTQRLPIYTAIGAATGMGVGWATCHILTKRSLGKVHIGGTIACAAAGLILGGATALFWSYQHLKHQFLKSFRFSS